MIVIGALAGAVTAIVAIFIPWLPDAASEEAGPIDNVYWVITIICIIIFGVVAGVSLYAVYKFRARPDDEEDGAPIHGHTGLEIFWTAIPTAGVVAITVYSAVVLVDIEDIPPDSRVVEVTAQQFAWSYFYPEADVVSGELVLPIDESVLLSMRSPDVIHAFWVPEWRMKQDVVPGIETKLRITPNQFGEYSVICTELCGLGHSTMRARARVVDRAEFDSWLAEKQAEGPPAVSAAAEEGGE